MGGKSLRRSWSAAEIEKQLRAKEKPAGKSLAGVFKNVQTSDVTNQKAKTE